MKKIIKICLLTLIAIITLTGCTKKEIIESENYDSIRVYCPNCKHKNTIPVQVDSKICHWCKKKIMNNTRSHFTYKLNKLMKEGKENERETIRKTK